MSNSKDLIIATALKLFLQKSYYEVTMQDIVTATGLSKGAFYHYFNSKEKVFEEIINFYFDTSQLDAYNNFSKGSLWEFIQQYIVAATDRINRYNNATDEKGGILRANQFALIFDAMKLLPEFNEKQEQRKRSELIHWTEIISIAREKGEIASPLSDMQIAKLFIYQNYGVGVYFVRRTQVEELINEIGIQFKTIYDLIKAK
ncbi:TetR/AcrR family transcriptional regulator [Sphingobacterium sp. HSC-15S19]|uniref:TetR/AcrR family transcriptional regulator n=1 Tax=Sphingobacterium TaxID=28453 RepID=UPI003D1EF9B1